MVDLQLLEPEFQEKLKGFLTSFAKKSDYTISIIKGFVHPLEQARLWRQSRPDSIVDNVISTLQNQGGEFLAEILSKGSTVSGVHVTNDLPGISWFNWGRAIEIKILNQKGLPEPLNSKIYKEIYKQLTMNGLISGSSFKRDAKQPNLIQSCLGENPLEVMKIKDINLEMKKRFEHDIICD